MLKPILYVETNFAVGIAKGQDGDATAFLAGLSPEIRVIFPSVCFMETLAVLAFENKQRNKFHEELKRNAREARRDGSSDHAPVLAELLERSVTESDGLFNDIGKRLHLALHSLCERAERIELEIEMVRDCFGDNWLDDPTDNLILASVIHHARRYSLEPKAFASSNHVDFQQPQVTEALETAGVRYFKRTGSAVGWLRSQIPSEPT